MRISVFAPKLCLLSLCCLFLPGAASVAQIQPPPPPVTDTTPETPPPLEPGTPGAIEIPQPSIIRPQLRPEDIQGFIPAIARSVQFTGNTVFSSAELVQIAGIRSGQLATPEILSQAIKNIEEAYRQRGYVAAVVGLDVPEQGRAGTVTFDIAELRVVNVKFIGLRKTHESALRRMLSLQPGDLFNREELIHDFGQLQQLGIFSDVSFDLQPVQPGQATLVWDLKEVEKFNYASVGGSYAPQDGLIGTADIILGNLFGGGERLSLQAMISSIDGRFGGQAQYFDSWIAPKNTSLFVSGYSVPEFRFSGDLADVSGLGRYYERRTGFKGEVGQVWSPTLSVATGLRLEAVDVNNLPSNLFTNPQNQDANVYLANARAMWDTRDSTTNPLTGTYTIGYMEGGIADFNSGGTNGISKAWADRRWFVPLRKPQLDPTTGLPTRPVPVLAFRGLGGVSVGHLPFFEQYFVGGIGDLPLRGYTEGRFWGKYTALASIEARKPFSRYFSGVVFVDAGDAWGSDYQFRSDVVTDYNQYDGFSPRFGAGVGARYASSFGPIRLDFAYGDEFRTYLTVGQSF